MAIENNVLDAMKTVAQSEVSKVKYDRTIVAEIIGAVENTSNRYWVSNGAVRFQATAADAKSKYSAGQKVYVTIPNDDYSSENKVITGAYSDEDGYQISQSTDPFEDMIVAKYIDLTALKEEDDNSLYEKISLNTSNDFYGNINQIVTGISGSEQQKNEKLEISTAEGATISYFGYYDIYTESLSKIKFLNNKILILKEYFPIYIQINDKNNNVEKIYEVPESADNNYFFDYDGNYLEFKPLNIDTQKIKIYFFSESGAQQPLNFICEASWEITKKLGTANIDGIFKDCLMYRTIISKKIPISFLYEPKISYDYLGIEAHLDTSYNQENMKLPKNLKWEIKVALYGQSKGETETVLTTLSFSSAQVLGNAFQLSPQIKNQILFQNNIDFKLKEIKYVRFFFNLIGDDIDKPEKGKKIYEFELKELKLYFGYKKQTFNDLQILSYNIGQQEYNSDGGLDFWTYEVTDPENKSYYSFPTSANNDGISVNITGSAEVRVDNIEEYSKYLEGSTSYQGNYKVLLNELYSCLYDIFFDIQGEITVDLDDFYILENQGFLPPYGYPIKNYYWIAYQGSDTTNAAEYSTELGLGWKQIGKTGQFIEEKKEETIIVNGETQTKTIITQTDYEKILNGEEYYSNIDSFTGDWAGNKYPFSLEKDQKIEPIGSLMFSSGLTQNTGKVQRKLSLKLLKEATDEYYPELNKNAGYWWTIDFIRYLLQNAELYPNDSKFESQFTENVQKKLKDCLFYIYSLESTIKNNSDNGDDDSGSTSNKNKGSTPLILTFQSGDAGFYYDYDLQSKGMTKNSSQNKTLKTCLNDIGITEKPEETSQNNVFSVGNKTLTVEWQVKQAGGMISSSDNYQSHITSDSGKFYCYCNYSIADTYKKNSGGRIICKLKYDGAEYWGEVTLHFGVDPVGYLEPPVSSVYHSEIKFTNEAGQTSYGININNFSEQTVQKEIDYNSQGIETATYSEYKYWEPEKYTVQITKTYDYTQERTEIGEIPTVSSGSVISNIYLKCAPTADKITNSVLDFEEVSKIKAYINLKRMYCNKIKLDDLYCQHFLVIRYCNGQFEYFPIPLYTCDRLYYLNIEGIPENYQFSYNRYNQLKPGLSDVYNSCPVKLKRLDENGEPKYKSIDSNGLKFYHSIETVYSASNDYNFINHISYYKDKLFSELSSGEFVINPVDPSNLDKINDRGVAWALTTPRNYHRSDYFNFENYSSNDYWYRNIEKNMFLDYFLQVKNPSPGWVNTEDYKNYQQSTLENFFKTDVSYSYSEMYKPKIREKLKLFPNTNSISTFGSNHMIRSYSINTDSDSFSLTISKEWLLGKDNIGPQNFLLKIYSDGECVYTTSFVFNKSYDFVQSDLSYLQDFSDKINMIYNYLTNFTTI